MEDIDKIASPEQEPEQLTDDAAWDLHCALARRHAAAPDVDEAWQRFRHATGHRTAHRTLWRVAAVAAAIAAAVGLFVQLLPKHPTAGHPSADAVIVLQHDEADTMGVTMTRQFAALTDADSMPTVPKRPVATTRVAVAGDVNFAAPQAKSDVQMASVVLMTTPRGRDLHLTLSDGTRVWMNADSRLQFPEQFGAGRRVVRLTGEAYFEVAKDARRPFVVESSYMTATVLGTTFNMRAYSATDASLALVEGRVSVKPAAGGQPLVVSPGQEVTLSAARTAFAVRKADTYGLTQRKEGLFYFHDATMRQIMTELGRWYNKTVVFEDADLMDMRLHFVAERSLSLPQVINRLSEIDGVRITLSADDITIE